MTTTLPRFFSPKRKREPSESDYYSPSESPKSTVSITSLEEARIHEEVELGRHSPRAAVAGRFGELAIQGERRHSLGLTNGELQHAPISSLGQQLYAPDWRPDSISLQDRPHGVQDNQPPKHPAQDCTNNSLVTPTASPSKKKCVAFPLTDSDPASPSKTRKKRFSPPLADDSPEDPFTWHDSEITGHNPTDPTDDGYGINGVGFKPTAAMAWARSQKRQRQVAEWKNREAREAREKRRERRNEAINMDKIHSIRQGAINKRVKFDV